ncbi:PrgI family protein [Patescibacteria group bacterium]|nr:PrgI family protein [Patescibacteria group bacterium]
MEQHPIPQQISSYEFKLVGEMTLKQFLKAGGGIAVAFLINSTKMFILFRLPLMALFGLGGLALAFVPFQDRPLETWIFSFWKAIWSPTIYTYKKRGDKNWMDWQAKKKVEEVVEVAEVTVKNRDESKIKEFIETLPTIKNIKKDKAKEEAEARPETRVKEEKEEKEGKEKLDWREQKMNLDLKKKRLEATGEAVFGSIPMPAIPDVPNLIVGMVTDMDGKIAENAIVEIQDERGIPARVLKTNSLGQFRSSTQLANGKYLIITEKEGNEFNRINVELGGRIVEPVKIRAIG